MFKKNVWETTNLFYFRTYNGLLYLTTVCPVGMACVGDFDLVHAKYLANMADIPFHLSPLDVSTDVKQNPK